MKLQKLYRYVRQAVDDYQMIDEGDVIAVGLSGGKDSLTLLIGLCGLRRFYPVPFEVKAIYVNLGWPTPTSQDLAPIRSLCEKLDVPFQLVQTSIGEIVFEKRREKHPCSLCSRMRKGALNTCALSLGCSKVAYGHHLDDLVETMLLSLLYEGTFHAYPPVTHLDRTGLVVLRPLLYVTEAEIVDFRDRYQLPTIASPCPANGRTKRQAVKELLSQIERDNPGAKKRMFTAITHGHLPDWPERNPSSR